MFILVPCTDARLDTTPERQTGRKAQISNITAAKVCVSVHLRRSTTECYIDGCRRDKNMSRTQGYAQNDFGSDGRYSVRLRTRFSEAKVHTTDRAFCLG